MPAQSLGSGSHLSGGAVSNQPPDGAAPHRPPDGAGSERTDARPGAVRNVRVGRQAVYDAKRQLVSYELLFRERSGRGTDAVGAEQATSQVIATTFGTFGLDTISNGKPVFINFTRGFLTGLLPIPVEPDNVIIMVTDRVTVDHELLLGLAQLREGGYRLAIDNYRGDLGRSALVEIADFVKINISTLPSLVAPGIVGLCRHAGVTLVAQDVPDRETLQRCVDLGFELFQGEYLQRPTVLERRTLSPSQLLCARLLNDLGDPEVSVARIEQLVGSDPGLSLRLLRSAHTVSGAGRQIESLSQALVLVGPRRLRSWVVLTLMEGGAAENSSDDLWSVLTRAHACQRLAGREADLGFTVGLLSGAADLLGADVETVADGAGVGPQMHAALLQGAGMAGAALRAILAHERNDPEAIEATGLLPDDVDRAYLEALRDALRIVHEFLGS